MRAKLFFFIYGALARFIQHTGILKIVGVPASRIQAFKNISFDQNIPSAQASILFHAASVGEFETLVPLMDSFLKLPIPQTIAITYFSASAVNSVNRWFAALSIENQSKILYRGFCPSEVHWSHFLQFLNIQKVIITKYEAWPLLWKSIAEKNIPLVLIQAMPRPSIKILIGLFKILGIHFPKLLLVNSEAENLNLLKNLIPEAAVFQSSDPRWIRAWNRSQQTPIDIQNRIQEIHNQYSDRPRPWIWVGSAWDEDLEILDSADSFSGSFFVFPHQLTHSFRTSLRHSVWINESGILAESYRLADAVWVGGGFGKGVHSTIEPAIHSKPIACGTKNAEKFSEILKLKKTGQLTVCERATEVQKWLMDQVMASVDPGRAVQWDFSSDLIQSDLNRLVEQIQSFR
jgi:3-deoxy-D-manno-octulosonic-acid transferase